MNFSVNPQKYGSVFVLPAEVADKYIKTCSGSFLSVLIVMFRFAPAVLDAQSIARRAGVSLSEAEDALEFWKNEGFIAESAVSEAVQAVPETEQTKSTAAADFLPAAHSVRETTQADFSASQKVPETGETAVAPPKKTRLRPAFPSLQQVHERTCESEEVRTLFTEAQEYLGRTIGLGDQGTLLLMYDFYGLPIDIILMLCGYASQQGKGGNMRYILALGEDWGEREIDTDEKAQAELKRLENIDTRWEQLRSMTGIRSAKPTKAQKDFLSKWFDTLGFTSEMVSIAFTKMSEHSDTTSFSYMDKILTRWHTEGVKTPQAVEKNDAEYEARKQRKTETSSAPRKSGKTGVDGGLSTTRASYDIEKAMEKARTVPKTIKKRRK